MKKKRTDDEMRDHYDFSDSWRNPYAGAILKFKHGGKRPGAGRKPVRQPLTSHTVTLASRHVRFLKSLDRNISRAIRRLIESAQS